MNTHGLNTFFGIAFLIALLGFVWVEWSHRITPTKNEPVACTMDALLCPDGSAVGRVGPSCAFEPCPTPPPSDPVGDAITAHADLIVLESPARDSIITSPVTLTGMARGYWYFEASFPIVIVDWDGRIIGEGYATAESDWMTEDFVPFKANMEFVLASGTPSRTGSIILQKDNPSSLPENDDALEVPVRF